MTDEPVSAIRNLGPKSVESFARAGIKSAAELRALGADEAYRRLLNAGTRPHFIGYYALVMGLQGRAWNDLDPAEKAHLRTRFDALVAEAGGQGASRLEAALDRLGVVNRS
ncbi:MAG: TfoX/Sxy family DNA transformation protein [Pseudomonadota bacterium]